MDKCIPLNKKVFTQVGKDTSKSLNIYYMQLFVVRIVGIQQGL